MAELDESGFGSVTLAVSGGVEEFLLSSDKSGFHFLLFVSWEILIFEGSDGDFPESSVELLAFLFSWVVKESSVGSENNGLDECLEASVLGVVFSNEIGIWLLFLLVSLVSLPVD